MSKDNKARISFWASVAILLLVVVLGEVLNATSSPSGEDGSSRYIIYVLGLCTIIGIGFAIASTLYNKERIYKIGSILVGLFLLVSLGGAVYSLLVGGIGFLG